MISKKESKVFKDLLEVKPAAQIEKYLEQQGITNRNGQPFSQSFISRVLNGKTAHRELEKHIWDFIEVETLRKQQEETKRAQLLEAAENMTCNV
tara:strand:- start:107 stop:388 length:282 start_codon:yes stop_codon:yes gene_type:complete